MIDMTRTTLIIGAMIATLLTSTIAAAAAPVLANDVNSDDTITNDIPPDGEGLFCDHPSNPSSCYDIPEYFCVNNPQYTKFCEIIGLSVMMKARYTVQILNVPPKDEPCPENFVRYNEYCAPYRTNCDENPTNVYCSSQRRTDGLLRCDQPAEIPSRIPMGNLRILLP